MLASRFPQAVVVLVERVLCLAVCVLACSSSFAQREETSPGTENQITLRGCLVDQSGFLHLFDQEKNYHLIGDAAELIKFSSDRTTPIIVRGTSGGPVQPPPSLGGTYEDFHVISANQFTVPTLTSSATFRDASKWQEYTNQQYGIRFAHPSDYPNADGQPASAIDTDFVVKDGVVPLGGFEIPGDTYGRRAFDGGHFRAFANLKIDNRGSCLQFREVLPEFLSSQTIGDIEYSKAMIVSGGMGTLVNDYYFHAFQNGVCYEIVFEVRGFSQDGGPLACTVRKLIKQDEPDLMQALIAKVSFPHPTVAIASARNDVVPQITSFVASPDTAKSEADPMRLSLDLTWTATGADYVKFSYACSDVTVGLVAISEHGSASRECANSTTTYPDLASTFPPNSSTYISLASYGDHDPRSVVITITPFSLGQAYPDSSKSITVKVPSHDPQ